MALVAIIYSVEDVCPREIQCFWFVIIGLVAGYHGCLCHPILAHQRCFWVRCWCNTMAQSLWHINFWSFHSVVFCNSSASNYIIRSSHLFWLYDERIYLWCITLVRKSIFEFRKCFRLFVPSMSFATITCLLWFTVAWLFSAISLGNKRPCSVFNDVSGIKIWLLLCKFTDNCWIQEFQIWKAASFYSQLEHILLSNSFKSFISV